MRIPLFFTLFLIHILSSATNFLFKDSKSDYSIIVSNQASTTEKTAAQELKKYIKGISGIDLSVLSKEQDPSDGHFIYVGWNKYCNSAKPQDHFQGYTYKTQDDDIFIFGGKEYGTMYGVFSFLENELGIRWYTSTFTHIPFYSSFEIRQWNHSEAPAVPMRNDFYYDCLHNPSWAAHNKISTPYKSANGKYGNRYSIWGNHTFKTLISPEKYFNTHPEYFSIYKGKRSNKAQLCLSNKEMQKELIKNLLEIIKNNPGYRCYDVSQNDISAPCECNSCRKLTVKHGGESGAILWFVNKVAKEIKKQYPDVYISTFAYRYTRKAPNSTIKPEENVVIRLCDIECCMAHPLESCPMNKDFIHDFQEWKKIARNIYIWDYCTGFMHYLIPFPSINTLAKNYSYFADNKVIGILEEGQYESEWGEFSELKQWIVAKCLWNPHVNVDSLVNTFIKDYYGTSATYVNKYYELCNSLVNKDSHFTIKIEPQNSIYSNSFITHGNDILDKAIEQSKRDSTVRKRVMRLKAQLLYLQIGNANNNQARQESISQLKEILKEDETLVSEHGYTIDNLIKDTGYK